MLTAIKQDISQWIPWVKGLENIKLKKAVQVYPGRKFANDLDAAKRDDNPVRYLYQLEPPVTKSEGFPFRLLTRQCTYIQ